MMKRILWITLSGLLGLLLGAAYLDFDLKDAYRSTGTLLVTRAVVSGKYAPLRPIDRNELMQLASEQFLSRAAAQNIIQTRNLYAEDSQATPMEDLAERLRNNFGMKTLSEDNIQISFVYNDPDTAKQVLQHISSLLVADHNFARQKATAQTVAILQDLLRVAACRITKAESPLNGGSCSDARVISNPPGNTSYGQEKYLDPKYYDDLKNFNSGSNHQQAAPTQPAPPPQIEPHWDLPLNLELQKDAYKAWHAMLAEVMNTSTLEKMHLGPSLLIDEPASDGVPTRWPVGSTLATGLGVGLALGYAVSMLATGSMQRASQQ